MLIDFLMEIRLLTTVGGVHRVKYYGSISVLSKEGDQPFQRRIALFTNIL